jgi:hypothetical protein
MSTVHDVKLTFRQCPRIFGTRRPSARTSMMSGTGPAATEPSIPRLRLARRRIMLSEGHNDSGKSSSSGAQVLLGRSGASARSPIACCFPIYHIRTWQCRDWPVLYSCTISLTIRSCLLICCIAKVKASLRCMAVMGWSELSSHALSCPVAIDYRNAVLL